MTSRFNASRVLTYLVLICLSILILFPMYITVVTALKTPAESAASFLALPSTFSISNFQQVIEKSNFFTSLKNTFVITLSSTLLVVLVNALVSYFIVRNEHKAFFKFAYIYFIIGMFIPFQVLMLPLVKFAGKCNMTNIPGLIFFYIIFSFPTNIFLFSGFIKTISLELEESAIIDGCSKLGVFFKIVFPLLKPITATVSIFNVLWVWNDFLLPLLMISKNMDFYTLPLFQYTFTTKYTTDYNLSFASYLLALIPPIILYLFCQKYIVKGITEGAVKG